MMYRQQNIIIYLTQNIKSITIWYMHKSKWVTGTMIHLGKILKRVDIRMQILQFQPIKFVRNITKF